ncbi:MAG: alpha/beta fold hydrolase [Thermoplasmatota archaeon]
MSRPNPPGHALEERRVPVGRFEIRTLLAMESGGPPVVLLHGFGAWADAVWLPTIEALRPHFTVIAPDLVGFGRSSKPGPEEYDVPDPLVPSAKAIEGLLRALHVQRATLVGSSFGGGVALHVAADAPKLVGRLVLVDSMGLGRSIHPAYQLLAMPGLGPRLVRPSKDRIRRVWHALVRDPALITDSLIEENFHLLQEPGATDVLLAARHGVGIFGQKLQYLDLLPRIDVPSLIVWGRNDAVFPVRHARRALRLLPHATLATIDACGHIPPMEKPETFNRILLSWLATGRVAPDLAAVEAAPHVPAAPEAAAPRSANAGADSSQPSKAGTFFDRAS